MVTPFSSIHGREEVARQQHELRVGEEVEGDRALDDDLGVRLQLDEVVRLLGLDGLGLLQVLLRALERRAEHLRRPHALAVGVDEARAAREALLLELQPAALLLRHLRDLRRRVLALLTLARLGHDLEYVGVQA